MRKTIEALGAIRAALHYFLQFIQGSMLLITLWATTSYILPVIGFVTIGAKFAEIAEMHKNFSISKPEYLLIIVVIGGLNMRLINLILENVCSIFGAVIGAAAIPKLTELWQNVFGMFDENLGVILWLSPFLLIDFLLKADAKKIAEYGCNSVTTEIKDTGEMVLVNDQTVSLSNQTAEKE